MKMVLGDCVTCNFEDAGDFVSGLYRFRQAKFESKQIQDDTRMRFSMNTIISQYVNLFLGV